MTVIKNDVINEYTNSGSDRYSITFEYDRPEQVTVRTYNSDTNEYEDVTDWVFDGATAIRFTGVVPNTFQIVRVTDISQSYGTSRYAVFQQGSAIKAGDLNGNLELLRLAIEENANDIDGQQDQIDDLNDEIDRLDGRIDQEIIDRENGDQNLQDQIDSIEGGSLDGRYVNVTGDTMTGPLSMSNNRIDTLADPSSPQDAVNLRTLQEYLDNEIGELDPNKQPSYVRFTFTATGGETVVTVPAYVTGGELVFINGAEQTRNVDYTPTNSTTITFAQKLLAGDVFDLYCVNTLKVIEVPVGDTSNLPVIRQTFTATADQKTFTLTGGEQYTPGKEQVFLNGNLLERDTDYTGNVGTSFVLEQGALAGDQVEIFCVNYTVDGGANTASNVSYTYPGGVQRTVQNRLEDSVSVKDFGAVGDGSTDDTEAFRNAIATYKKVFIPAGRYRITSSLPYPGNHPEGGIIQGEGQSSKLIIDIADPDSPWLFEADMDDVSGNGYSWNIRGYTFRDFSVENFDDATAYARKNGVFYFNGRTITANVIDNVHTFNVPQVAVHRGDTWGRGLKIVNCRFNLSTTTINDCFAVNLWNYCSIEHTDIIGGWTWCCLIEGKTTIKNFNIGGQITNRCGYSIYMRNTSDCLIENGYIEYCGEGQPSGAANIDAVVLDNTYSSSIRNIYAMQGMNVAAINCDPGTRSFSALPAKKVVELANIQYGGEDSANARPHFKCVHPVYVSSDAMSIGTNVKTINGTQFGYNGYRLIPNFGTQVDYQNGIFDTPNLPSGLPASSDVSRLSSTYSIINTSNRLALRAQDTAINHSTRDRIAFEATNLKANIPVTVAVCIQLDSRQTASGKLLLNTNTSTDDLIDTDSGMRNLYRNFAGLGISQGTDLSQLPGGLDNGGAETWKNTRYTLYAPGIVDGSGAIQFTVQGWLGALGGDTFNNLKIWGIQMFYGFNVFTNMDLINI